jgi:hypothetical protein
MVSTRERQTSVSEEDDAMTSGSEQGRLSRSQSGELGGMGGNNNDTSFGSSVYRERRSSHDDLDASMNTSYDYHEGEVTAPHDVYYDEDPVGNHLDELDNYLDDDSQWE